MNRPIRFRVWHIKERRWISLETFIGAGYVDVNESMDGVIIQQFTGLVDSKNVDIYEGDIIRYYKPSRSYQIHYSDNIPGPEGKYTEQLEPYIGVRVEAVRFVSGCFTFDTQKKVTQEEYVWPLKYSCPFYTNRGDLMQAFDTRTESAWIDGGDDETGDLTYLCREAGVETENDLIAHLNTFEVVGNVFENEELTNHVKSSTL